MDANRNKKVFLLRSKGAYSLAEVMVSASLLTVVLLMFIAISHSSASLGRLSSRNKALGIARATAEQIKLTNDNSSITSDGWRYIDVGANSYRIGASSSFNVSQSGQNFNVIVFPALTGNIITTPVTVTWRNPDGTTQNVTASSSLKRRRI